MGNFGVTEFVIIFLIILILFGAKKIPGILKSVGSSIKNFKKGLHEEEKKEE